MLLGAYGPRRCVYCLCAYGPLAHGIVASFVLEMPPKVLQVCRRLLHLRRISAVQTPLVLQMCVVMLHLQRFFP